MSLQGLDQGVAALEALPNAVPKTLTNDAVQHGTDVGLTARAVLFVTLAGAGIWYLLWKLAMLFVSGS